MARTEHGRCHGCGAVVPMAMTMGAQHFVGGRMCGPVIPPESKPAGKGLARTGIARGAGPKRSGRLKTRSYREVHAGDPDMYGAAYERVKLLPCFGRIFLAGHVCEGRHTAHHVVPASRGGTDLDGLLPCCELLHAPLDLRAVGRTKSDVLRDLGWTMDDLLGLAKAYTRGDRTWRGRKIAA